MMGWVHRLFHRQTEPPPPRVEVTSADEKRRMDEQNREITARLERLRLVAELSERSVLRQIEDRR